MATLMQRWMGQGNVVNADYSLGERMAGAVDITRPVLTVMGALGVAAAAAISFGGIPAWYQCLTGFIAALVAFAGIHSFNDFVDARRDLSCWPGRPIPSRRLTAWQALGLSIAAFCLSLALVGIVFSRLSLEISAVAVGLSCLYSAYLRDKVGYLVLPPIQGILWLCGWAAFSPDTLFTSWMPWVLYLFSIAWQSGHIMIYSPLHPLRKIKGVDLTQVPALFFKTSARTAATMGFWFLCLAVALSIFLGFYAHLGWLYLIPAVAMGLLALEYSRRFSAAPENFSGGIKAFSFATYFMLAVRVFILLSILLAV
jgi:4-hydroxybenzoate polyprenyltransferase